MATHSSILAWRMLWTEEHGRLWSMGSQRVRHDRATNTFLLSQMREAEKRSPQWWYNPEAGKSQCETLSEVGGIERNITVILKSKVKVIGANGPDLAPWQSVSLVNMNTQCKINSGKSIALDTLYHECSVYIYRSHTYIRMTQRSHQEAFMQNWEQGHLRQYPMIMSFQLFLSSAA